MVTLGLSTSQAAGNTAEFVRYVSQSCCWNYHGNGMIIHVQHVMYTKIDDLANVSFMTGVVLQLVIIAIWLSPYRTQWFSIFFVITPVCE